TEGGLATVARCAAPVLCPSGPTPRRQPAPPGGHGSSDRPAPAPDRTPALLGRKGISAQSDRPSVPPRPQPVTPGTRSADASSRRVSAVSADEGGRGNEPRQAP